MDVRGPWGLYLALAATSALIMLPQGCVEEPPGGSDEDDGDGCPEGFPTRCDDGRCCPEGTVCVPEGCCAEATPVNCGFGVCAATEDGCAELGMGFPPCDGLGSCPEEGMYCLLGGIGTVCLPECGDGCPSPGVCAFNPESSTMNCEVEGMCDDPDETCTDNAGGGRTCLLPESHCVPRCQVLADCPSGMDCVDTVCLFANSGD